MQLLVIQVENMQTKQDSILFIFRRDLRLEDNLALIKALQTGAIVIPVYILNPEQIQPHHNPYHNPKTIQFLCDSLTQLSQSLQTRGSRLLLFYGRHQHVLDILQSTGARRVIQNMDITPYAIRRRKALAKLLGEAGVEYQCVEEDYSLLSSQCYLKGQGVFYKSFTDYYRSVAKKAINQPIANPYQNFVRKEVKFSCEWKGFLSDLFVQQPYITRGGRIQAFKLLSKISDQKDYSKNRNFPAVPTTKLAPFLKWGCISARQFHAIVSTKLGVHHDLVRQLYWRDFFYHLTFNCPHVENSNFYPQFNQVTWRDWPQGMTCWVQGRTGCPLVDAGMRQLAKEGWMANILRLLTANFLIKNLFIDWREGEKHFARTLVDYDWGINNGSWQFVAGTGKVQQPYYLLINCFNSHTFDPSCSYIRQWIPQLQDVPDEAIHDWPSQHSLHSECGYPAPIVDHLDSSKAYMDTWESIAAGEAEDDEMVELQDLGRTIELQQYDMEWAYTAM